MTRVGVVGATGRMGTTVCAAVAADPDLVLACAVGRPARDGTGRVVAGGAVERHVDGLEVAYELHALADARCDVVVDFTVASAARTTLPWLALHGMHAVVGTSGFDDDDFALFESSFCGDDGPNCVIAPNFAISAVLMMRFAEMAAPWFDTAEVIELHHDRKVDAPSGTAIGTVERMAAARGVDFAPDPTEDEVYAGARGGAGPHGIRVHSVRMRGMVAHQEVILGATGQTLTIRQDSYDRESFMPGVLLACKHIAEHPGLTRSLDPFVA
jgi:4-hydroxy-tetrahydrodipicolinate reductase